MDFNDLLGSLTALTTGVSSALGNLPDQLQTRMLKKELRDWYSELVKSHTQFACFGFLLALPGDQQAIDYLTRYGQELDLISGQNCAIIGFGKIKMKKYEESAWNKLVMEQINNGYNIAVANFFDIDLTEFPCLILFKDFNTFEYIQVPLKNLTTKDICVEMRKVFSAINQAVFNEESPIASLVEYQRKEKVKKAGEAGLNKVKGYVDKSFQTALQEMIKQIISRSTGTPSA